MESKELEKFKEEVLEKKIKLERELEEIANKNPDKKGHYDIRFPQYGDSQDENALEVSEADRIQAIEENLEQELESINKTLAKIEKGTYGVCDSCSNIIENKRLEAMPVASLCISCAKKIF